jgi:SnoaL-like domain
MHFTKLTYLHLKIIMMKKILLYGICLMLLWSCSYNASVNVNTTNADEDKKAVAALLDSLNAAAAKANHSQYFSYFADSAVFAGTDATERWHKASFMAWSKPYFDRGKAWNFTAAQRHIYLGKDGQTAWFDELLNTCGYQKQRPMENRAVYLKHDLAQPPGRYHCSHEKG